MLYTSYISNLKNIPNNYIKLIITRYPPKNFNVLKFSKTYIVTELSPSKELIDKYNKTSKTIEDWDIYKIDFMKELLNREDMKNNLNKIINGINKNLDICLICYEKDYKRCHRTLIAEYLKNKYNISYKEF